jgi:radical SAM protein with 4Fe4S-binding SPASM domain
VTALLEGLARVLARWFGGARRFDLTVGPDGPRGPIQVPGLGDGVWEIARVDGRDCLRPDERSHYLYFCLPPGLLDRAGRELWLDVEYHDEGHARFRIQYACRDEARSSQGLYEPAEQRWDGQPSQPRFRRALFRLADVDKKRTQNFGATFRVEFRERVMISRLSVLLDEPGDLAALPALAPLPELKKLPGRHYPINYLFIEITNACNFKCSWCPDEIMQRKRGLMKKEQAFQILDEIASKKSWLGPLYPVKLHQMGEPMLHPALVEIVEHAESRGVGIELNTNCGLITEERVDALYRAGLTSLILSYQTPDAESFKTRKAPRLVFEDYHAKVRLAVERKVALGARTQLEIDIMNTKATEGFSIVDADEVAISFVREWTEFSRSLEQRYGLPRREHDIDAVRRRRLLDQDENGSRYPLLDGVDLIWKRCHTWGNVIGEPLPAKEPSTYCPAPYDQFVIQWNGDVATCCTDYEGLTKIANVFEQSVEAVWTGEALRQRKRDMLEGRLLDVCAKCQGFAALIPLKDIARRSPSP